MPDLFQNFRLPKSYLARHSQLHTQQPFFFLSFFLLMILYFRGSYTNRPYASIVRTNLKGHPLASWLFHHICVPSGGKYLTLGIYNWVVHRNHAEGKFVTTRTIYNPRHRVLTIGLLLFPFTHFNSCNRCYFKPSPSPMIQCISLQYFEKLSMALSTNLVYVNRMMKGIGFSTNDRNADIDSVDGR